MDMQNLEQFLAIVKCQSMRAAAESLFLSQSALSHSLKQMEEELSCQLFGRSRQKLNLNAYGKIMQKHAENILQELDLAKQEIRAEQLRQAQKIRIGVYGYAFASFVMPNLANAVQGPVLECQILDNQSMENALCKGELDLIVPSAAPKGENLCVQRLFQEQIMISLPSSSPYAARQNLFLTDLQHLDLYLVSDASGYTAWFEQILRQAEVTVPQENMVPFQEYLYTKDGDARCHLTTSFIERFLPNVVRRVLVPLSDTISSRTVFLVYPKKNQEKLSALLSYIEQYQDRLFSGSAFLPYFLFPSEETTLQFRTQSKD